MNELEITPTNDELTDLDPIGIETEIKKLEHEEFVLMTKVYPIRHSISQLKHELSIARAKYWRGKS
jgi:hypothetical protein